MKAKHKSHLVEFLAKLICMFVVFPFVVLFTAGVVVGLVQPDKSDTLMKIAILLFALCSGGLVGINAFTFLSPSD